MTHNLIHDQDKPMKQFWSQGKLWCKGDESKVDKHGRSSCLICGRAFSLASGYSFVHEAAKFAEGIENG